MKRTQAPLPTEAKRRLRSAAHRAAIRFESDESARLLDGLRELIKSQATEEQVEHFVRTAEGKVWG